MFEFPQKNAGILTTTRPGTRFIAQIDLLEKIRLEEDAQRERERNSNAMQEAAAKIEQPGSERDR